MGHVFPALLDLFAEVLAQVGEGLELFAEVLGELVVEFGQGALAHFVGCHCEMRGLAGELFVGQVLAVSEADLALFASAHADEGLFKLGAEGILVADEDLALLVLVANDGQAAVVEALQIRDEHVAVGQRSLDDLFGGVAAAQFL